MNSTGYKYIAIILIMLLTVYISFSIRKYGRDKISFHAKIIDFIVYVKQQIAFFCTPTKKIISEYTMTDIKGSGIFDEGGIDRNIYLDERGKQLMKEFFINLGRSSSEEQAANCDYAIEGMKSLLEEYKKEEIKKYKAYSTLAYIIGGMTVILLL